MASPEPAEPVKLFAAILFAEEASFARARDRLSEELGPVDFEGESIPFDVTDYYEPEFGGHLQRRIVSFAEPIGPDAIVDMKMLTNRIEDELLDTSLHRTVNIDPGYLDYDKVILPSCKRGAQKIYLRDGVWADPTLRYAKGKFHAFEWTFPDFRDERYHKALLRIREIHKQRAADKKSS